MLPAAQPCPRNILPAARPASPWHYACRPAIPGTGCSPNRPGDQLLPTGRIQACSAPGRCPICPEVISQLLLCFAKNHLAFGSTIYAISKKKGGSLEVGDAGGGQGVLGRGILVLSASDAAIRRGRLGVLLLQHVGIWTVALFPPPPRPAISPIHGAGHPRGVCKLLTN